MKTYIIVSQGQLIDTQFQRTLDGFVEKIADIEKDKQITIEQSEILENTHGKPAIKQHILQRFLEIVAIFRINGFNPDAEPSLNERIFREETRRLLKVTADELPDPVFDEIWCRMCGVEATHAMRYRELLSQPYTIFHSGTNSIQAAYIASRLRVFGVEVPPARLFLSYAHGCEYKRVPGKQNLIYKIFDSLNLEAGDKVLLVQGSKDNIPPIFQPVAIERYDDSARTAVEIWPFTTVVTWNNNACNSDGQCISLIDYLRKNKLFEMLPSGMAALTLSHYPSLENKFNQLDPSIRGDLTFNAIKMQLTWAFNEYEQKRAIHRLHCIIDLFISNNLPTIQRLSPPEKQALIALTLLDGCKNSKECIEAFQHRGFAALKDAVPSFFKMMATAPEIFPIYGYLLAAAKDSIRYRFFYLHLRHLRLGEVPACSISRETLSRPRHLMDAFWYANDCGFSIEKPGYPLGENTGPTFSVEYNKQFADLLRALDERTLINYYLTGSILVDRHNLRSAFTGAEAEFICRLGKMLTFIGLVENNPDYARFVAGNSSLIKAITSEEAKAFSGHYIEAITFLPAVLKTLREKIMPDKSVGEILEVFLLLQKQLYLSVPNFINSLGENRTIPLFGLSSQQEEILRSFANAVDKSTFHFEASMGHFININLCAGPILQPAAPSALMTASC